MSTTDNPKIWSSSPVAVFLLNLFCFNTILASMPKQSTLGKPRLNDSRSSQKCTVDLERDAFAPSMQLF